LSSFSTQNISLHALLAAKVSVEKFAVIFGGFIFICYLIFLLAVFNILSLFSVLICFNYNMLWRGSVSVMSIWCPRGFLYLHGHFFLTIWEIFCNYFVEYITYTFGLHLFSFFDSHDLQVWSFDGSQSCYIFLSQLLSLFSKSSSLFSLISILSSSLEILSSTCSSLLE
jgi:hypothetical protein